MEQKIRDDELHALQVITEALAPLDRPACARVLKWADQRFVDYVGPTVAIQAGGRFLEGVNDAAAKLNRSPLEILNAIQLVVRLADRAKAREEAKDDEPEEARA